MERLQMNFRRLKRGRVTQKLFDNYKGANISPEYIEKELG